MPEERRSVADRVIDDKQRGANGPAPTSRWAWEWVKSILIAFGLFLVIRTFLVEAFRIPTGSMENTLLVGDFLLVNKAVFGPFIPGTRARLPAFSEPGAGDIVVFVPPHELDRNYVKRLVGMPGDTLAMQDKTLYRNGQPQAEPYARYSDFQDTFPAGMVWQCEHGVAQKPGTACRPTRDNWGPLVVPAGHFFMLGDNRDDSEDSRYWGFVERDAIKGKPLFIYYSFDPGTPRPAPWLTSIRWNRIGNTVH